jgi:hypothetical protein
MKTLIWAMVSAIIGGVLGGFLSLGFGTSMGVASGLIQGSQIGICVAAQTADTAELLEAGQGDVLIAQSIAKIQARIQGLPTQGEVVWVSDEAGCAELLGKLGPPASSSQRQE